MRYSNFEAVYLINRFIFQSNQNPTSQQVLGREVHFFEGRVVAKGEVIGEIRRVFAGRRSSADRLRHCPHMIRSTSATYTKIPKYGKNQFCTCMPLAELMCRGERVDSPDSEFRGLLRELRHFESCHKVRLEFHVHLIMSAKSLHGGLLGGGPVGNGESGDGSGYVLAEFLQQRQHGLGATGAVQTDNVSTSFLLIEAGGQRYDTERASVP